MNTRIGTRLFLALWLPAMASGAPQQDIAQAARSRAPMGFPIQCPYIPLGLDPVPTCQGRPATCVGTDGDDMLWGTEDDEVIMGLAGDDVIQGDEGDDVICAGPGNDAVHGARGNDSLFGEDGDDWLFGARGKDSLYGGEGDRDVLWGGPELDYLDGGAGARDVCLQQRDEANVNVDTCEVIFPPAGYDHEKQHAFAPGIVKEAMQSPGKVD
ncbi:MAG: calcium-binding protein [Pseudomonadota bacterium]|nr:calcium-binding protein [Pseudomonadota bacterium]